MTNPLLIVTSDVPFGESIRQSLEETGRFTVRVTDRAETAASYVLDTGCSFVILDTSLQGEDMLTLGRSLRLADPMVQFVAISEAGWHLALEELAPLLYLSKPIFLPDLLDTVNKAFPVLKPSIETNRLEMSSDESALPWLSDVSRAAQHLTRLTLESSAQAALITRNEQPWAYAGQLPQTANVELAETLTRYWGRQKENDLVRFVRLTATGAEHMMYATRLSPDTLLALIFDAETSFSTIRVQASRLVHSLTVSPVAEAPAPAAEAADDTPPTPSISNILTDVPSPNPSGNIFTAAADRPRETARPAIQWPRANAQKQRQAAPLPLNSLKPPETQERPENPLTSLEQTVPSAAVTRKSKPRRNELLTEEANETRPSSITEVARKIVLEPVSPAVYNLDYACLLLPRFAHHHLTGDLSERMGDLVPQICVAFGWRLEYISIRPEYLQWIVNVPPSTSPAYLMRALRQQTSEKIFAEFPRFKKENPSGDFWAPGYLIMGGSQPPPAQLIKDFINQTRLRQGLAPQFHS